MKPKNCTECDKAFEPEHELDFHCPACKVAIEDELKAREVQATEDRRSRAEHAVAKATPLRVGRTDVEFPTFNRKLLAKATKWAPKADKSWLGLIGAAGTCKTRVAFMLLRELVGNFAENNGRIPTFGVISGPDFNRIALERFSKERPKDFQLGGETIADTAARTLRNARECDILLFDELGKVRPTPATVDELFALIDHRHSWEKPMIWTANTAPDEFCSGWPDEFGPPSTGRILEASTIISIAKPKA